MSFIPRALANGHVCCTDPRALCDRCQIYHAQRAESEPINIYTADLKALRAAQGTSESVIPDSDVEDLFTDVPQLNQSPARLATAEMVADCDPYAEALAAMRANR